MKNLNLLIVALVNYTDETTFYEAYTLFPPKGRNSSIFLNVFSCKTTLGVSENYEDTSGYDTNLCLSLQELAEKIQGVVDEEWENGLGNIDFYFDFPSSLSVGFEKIGKEMLPVVERAAYQRKLTEAERFDFVMNLKKLKTKPDY